MATLKGSVQADVPIRFADREWTEFLYRSRYGNYTKSIDEITPAVSEADADAGTVSFETKGDRLTRVSVELEYTPRDGRDPDDEIRQAQRHLDRDLEEYRTFLLERCEQLNCRQS